MNSKTSSDDSPVSEVEFYVNSDSGLDSQGEEIKDKAGRLARRTKINEKKKKHAEKQSRKSKSADS
jgi:hypothetical protein